MQKLTQAQKEKLQALAKEILPIFQADNLHWAIDYIEGREVPAGIKGHIKDLAANVQVIFEAMKAGEIDKDKIRAKIKLLTADQVVYGRPTDYDTTNISHKIK